MNKREAILRRNAIRQLVAEGILDGDSVFNNGWFDGIFGQNKQQANTADTATTTNTDYSRYKIAIPAQGAQFITYIQGKGINPACACGIAANVQNESNFNPSAVGDNGNAYGICQWWRWGQEDFQRMMGKPMQGSTWQQQADFLIKDLSQKGLLSKMNVQNITPQQAAGIMCAQYEKPQNGQEGQSINNKRKQIAAGFYATLQQK